MLLKEADPKDQTIQELERLLGEGKGSRRKDIERELRIMKAGINGEKDAAYFIDFEYKASANWIVIHDLRLEVGDRVAQIDHLLMNRILECFVLETKHFKTALRITDDGEFERFDEYDKRWDGLPSPIAQNDRHIAVLRDAFATIDMPTRLGLRLAPTFINLVLVSPSARVERPKGFDTSKVIKADVLKSVLERDAPAGVLDAIGSVARVVSSETLQDIGRKLLKLHRPKPMDVRARFGAATGELAAAGGTRGSGRLAQSDVAGRPNARPGSTVVPSGILAREDDPPPRCKGCNGAKLAILYGSSYYFKCADCGTNTPARVNCGQAGHRERLRKDGRNFFRECADCGTSVLYFINPT